MMKIKLFYPTLFVLQLFIINVNAQVDTTNNAYFFDDGGISNAKNIFKVNVISIINGDLPFYYERVLNKSFGLEVGAGILLPYYIPEIIPLLSGETIINNPNYGYSIWFQPKYYLLKKAPEYSYMSFQYRRRNYYQNIQSIVFSDITFGYGTQLFIGKRFLFDYNTGIGYRHVIIKQEDVNISTRDDVYNNINGVLLYINIKLGLIYK